MARFAFSALLALGIAMGSEGAAGAFCRKTTCDEAKRHCDKDANDCVIFDEKKIFPLRWMRGCVSYSLDATNIRTADLNKTLELVNAAFRTWKQTTCGEKAQPISIDARHAWGLVLCDHVEYNARQGNANIVTFRNPWPYHAVGDYDELGRTTVTYLTDTGEIVDADIEIRDDGAFKFTTSTPVPPDGNDLQSILTHEIGHFLGLAHSSDEQAVMYYSRAAGTNFRTLTDDDVQGICEIYTPDPNATCEFTPKNGFSAECAINPYVGGACATDHAGLPKRGLAVMFLASAVLGLAGLRRRRARSS